MEQGRKTVPPPALLEEHMRTLSKPEIRDHGTPEGQAFERWIAGQDNGPQECPDSSRVGKAASRRVAANPSPHCLRQRAAKRGRLFTPHPNRHDPCPQWGRPHPIRPPPLRHWRATNRAGPRSRCRCRPRFSVLGSYSRPAQHYLVSISSRPCECPDGVPVPRQDQPDRQACRVPDCRCPSPCRAIARARWWRPLSASTGVIPPRAKTPSLPSRADAACWPCAAECSTLTPRSAQFVGPRAAGLSHRRRPIRRPSTPPAMAASPCLGGWWVDQ